MPEVVLGTELAKESFGALPEPFWRGDGGQACGVGGSHRSVGTQSDGAKPLKSLPLVAVRGSSFFRKAYGNH